MKIRAWLSVCLSILFASHVAAATQQQGVEAPRLPETDAGRRVAEYVKAFNTGDEQRMGAFIAEHVAPEALARRGADERLQVYRQMREGMGALEARRVLEARADRVNVLFETRTGRWVEIGFMFEPSPPHKLIGLRIEDAEPPAAASTVAATTGAAAPASTMTEQEFVASVEKFLSGASASDEFSGAVLIAKGDRAVFQKAYGLASREYSVPNRTDTKFNLGSINKIFTQVAVGQLVEQGKLSLDDKLGKHLPDYPNKQAAEKVTVRQLLSMSSGIGDFFGDKFDATAKDRLRSVKDFLPLFASEPLRFEPGTRREYSNGGYIVLGAVVEKVSGRDYYEYVRENIFTPAGMARRNNVYTLPAKGSPAGGGYSTADDMLKFALALQTGKLRVPDFRSPAAATTQQAGAAPSRGTFQGIGIAGGAPGINAMFMAGAPGGYTVIVMSNYDPPSAEKVSRQIRELVERVQK
jgi:CubicO group peptidase (beta-lactamase class C family)